MVNLEFFIELHKPTSFMHTFTFTFNNKYTAVYYLYSFINLLRALTRGYLIGVSDGSWDGEGGRCGHNWL